jgi:phage shock protein C
VNPRRLYRSADDRILAGVCAGVADYFDVDPAIVRILWFLSVFFTGSLTFWAYLVMIIVVPLEPDHWPAPSPWAPGGAPVGPAGGYNATGTNYPGGYPAGAMPATDPSASGVPGATGGSSSGEADPNVAPPADPTAPADPRPPFAATSGPVGGAWSNDWRSQRRQERWERRDARRAARHSDSTPGLVFGILLILAGGALAWHQLDPRIDLGFAWPIAVVVLGVLLVLTSFRRDSSGS